MPIIIPIDVILTLATVALGIEAFFGKVNWGLL